MNVSAAHNGHYGIELDYSTDTNMMNVSAAHNGGYGIVLYRSTDTSMMNVCAAHNGDDGIVLFYSTDTNMTNVSAAHNVEYGIVLFYSTDTNMMNVSAAHNGDDGIVLYYSTDTNMSEVSAAHNQHSDIAMMATTNTYITNTASVITAYDTTNIVFNDTSFSDMYAPSTASSTSEPTSLPAVITLYNSNLIVRDCNFTRNTISSIKTISSNVTMSGKVLFNNNTASSGTVLIFAKNSLLIITNYSNVQFQNNHALNHGGVFYITTEESYETSMSLSIVLVLVYPAFLVFVGYSYSRLCRN